MRLLSKFLRSKTFRGQNKCEKMLAQFWRVLTISPRKLLKQGTITHIILPELNMIKSSTHHTRFALVAAATGVLLATSQFASAAKVDPAITAATTAASTTDIEAIVSIAITQASAIANKTIKLSTANVNALASGLATAIAGKTGTDTVNRLDNKIDEIGEVEAFIVGTLATNKKMKKLGTAKNIITGLLKSALGSAISISPQVVTDVVGSVAQTIHNAPAFDKIETKLAKQLAKSASKIAGANASVFTTALNAGFAGSNAFEDGNIAALAVADPETDLRNG